MKKQWIALTLPIALAFSGCGDDGRPTYPTFESSILELATGLGHTTFVAAVSAGDRVGLLEGFAGTRNTYTVFVPDNDAFANADLPADVQAAVDAALARAAGMGPDLDVEQQRLLADLLFYHSVGGKRRATLIAASNELETVTATIVGVRSDGNGGIFLRNSNNDANIIATDIEASNGVIHVIDAVLAPPRGALDVELSQQGFTALVAAAQIAGLDAALADENADPITVFAPTDDAFNALLMALGGVGIGDVSADLVANVLLHHIVAGTQTSSTVLATTAFTTAAKTSLPVDTGATPPTVGGAPLDTSGLDIGARNGIIHTVDTVIVPPTILQVAAGSMDLERLVEAVTITTTTAVGVNPNTLGGEALVTVFAPIDSAFEDLGLVDAAALMMVGTSTLTDILNYHVVSGQVTSDMLVNGGIITTETGGTLTYSEIGEDKTLIDGQGNRVNIIETDIRTLTGVVHLIDGVLME